MKKSILVSITLAVLFVIVLNTKFMNSGYSIAIGILLGISIFLTGTLLFKKLDSKGKSDEDKL
ncbi:hypothetical protein RFF05_05180 [Bengtsoniella intestinalis]|uniref:hypothetical protein n=1 Tax=Bengtsoniella intestinalis TaxID=3073143 RepID=UPI00391F27EB